MVEDLPPVVFVHYKDETPESLLFVLDVSQEHSCYIVYSLAVPYFEVVAAVSFEYIVQLILASLRAHSKRFYIGKRSQEVLTDACFIFLILKG